MPKLTAKDLMKILKTHRKQLLKLRGVHHVDVGYKYSDGIRTDELAIRIHVYSKPGKAVLKKEMLPKRIQGARTDVIISTPVPESRFGKPFEVLAGGIEIQNKYVPGSGTLGGVFRNENGALVGLTNYHVLFDRSARLGDPISQPFRVSPGTMDFIGKLSGGIPKLDCATFEFNNRRRIHAGIIDLAPRISPLLHPPEHGAAVAKSGIATDVTFGVIDGVSPDGIFRIGPNAQKPNPGGRISALGDSGSIWVMDSGDGTEGLALHYRGDLRLPFAFAVDLSLVMRKMRLTFV